MGSVEALTTHMRAAAEHLSRHEAGHAALRLRAEDSDSCRDVDGLNKGDAAWRQPFAATLTTTASSSTQAPTPCHRYTRSITSRPRLHAYAPSSTKVGRPGSQTSPLPAVGQSGPRTVSSACLLTWRRSSESMSTTSLAAETPPRGWDDCIEDSWDAWSHTFHRLTPVNAAMTTDSIGAVLADLCRLTRAWLRSIGIESGTTDDDREYIFWEKDHY